MKIEKPSFWIGYFLDPEIGRGFVTPPMPQPYPPHLTILPPVPGEYDPDDGWGGVVSEFNPIKIGLRGIAWFGKNRDCEVRLTSRPRRLLRLHNALVQKAIELYNYQPSQYKSFRPHFTLSETDADPRSGDHFWINNLTIVQKLPDESHRAVDVLPLKNCAKIQL
ncbi:MAG: hypothetical protein LBM73_01590 [Candidatus Nomurabacteria bacterium]|nr:hypothetical protein [Candidatus Nomurabacteria bacterium]